MFKRLLLDDSAAIFTVVAFVTAFSIFATVCWRALRMSRPQTDQLARLPFADETSARRHDSE